MNATKNALFDIDFTAPFGMQADRCRVSHRTHQLQRHRCRHERNGLRSFSSSG
jgi:hypothetical protein